MSFKIGDRVKRGPDWVYFDQDCGDNGVPVTGTVTQDPHVGFLCNKTWVEIRWDNEHCNAYPLTDDDGKEVQVIQHVGTEQAEYVPLNKFLEL